MVNRVIVLGATGLVGQQILKCLDLQDSVHEVICLVRRPVALHFNKARFIVVDFMNIEDYKDLFVSVSAVFCSIGTTMRHAGSKSAFQLVDHYIPLVVARLAKDVGVPSFFLVSSSHANLTSRSFYLSVKGILESDIEKLLFDRLVIYRPALLSGNRQAFRLFETLFIFVFRWLSFFVPKRYRVIDAEDLAEKMVLDFMTLTNGFHVIERNMMTD